jgi:DNA-binding beta-propeller fold protein YncE
VKVPLQSISAEDIVVYPPLPQEPRIQYLTSISSSRDIEKEQSKFSKFLTGEDQARAIIKPYGMAIGHNKIYICDMTLNGVEIIDLENQTFERFVPKGLGALQTPVNCFLDVKDSLLYIADAKRRQIIVFDTDKNYVASFGEKENFRPADVSVWGDQIWVANSRGNGLFVYDKESRELIKKFPENYTSEDEGYLWMPLNIHISEDIIYVTDFGEFIVKKYSHSGEFLGSIGSYGLNMGQFTRPKGIASDRDGNTYVVDGAFENVQIFNDNAELMMFFGGIYEGPGGLWLPANVIIDYDHVDYFKQYVYSEYELDYLILVSSQFGPDKINVYGFIKSGE